MRCSVAIVFAAVCEFAAMSLEAQDPAWYVAGTGTVVVANRGMFGGTIGIGLAGGREFAAGGSTSVGVEAAGSYFPLQTVIRCAPPSGCGDARQVSSIIGGLLAASHALSVNARVAPYVRLAAGPMFATYVNAQANQNTIGGGATVVAESGVRTRNVDLGIGYHLVWASERSGRLVSVGLRLRP